MKAPTTPEEVLELHRLSVADPSRFIEIANDWIATNPTDAHAYFDRHFAWARMGQNQRALEDIDKSIELDPSPTALKARGDLHRRLGNYPLAARDYAQGEAISREQWAADAIPLLYQADTYARMGDQPNALAYCARLPDDFWTPGHSDLPPGGKTEISAELKRHASEARSTDASR
jgi:tetratricopeptide (TPR) repeat protein